VHAGILPLNPTIPLNSKHQPLSHVPGSLRQHSNKHRTHGHQIRTTSSIDDIVERDVRSDLERRAELSENRTEDSRNLLRKPKNGHDLRTLQEQLLLSTIPQNTIPFNLLNMRSLSKNRPTRGKKVCNVYFILELSSGYYLLLTSLTLGTAMVRNMERRARKVPGFP
jgi:hypothetical protein